MNIPDTLTSGLTPGQICAAFHYFKSMDNSARKAVVQDYGFACTQEYQRRHGLPSMSRQDFDLHMAEYDRSHPE